MLTVVDLIDRLQPTLGVSSLDLAVPRGRLFFMSVTRADVTAHRVGLPAGRQHCKLSEAAMRIAQLQFVRRTIS